MINHCSLIFAAPVLLCAVYSECSLILKVILLPHSANAVSVQLMCKVQVFCSACHCVMLRVQQHWSISSIGGDESSNGGLVRGASFGLASSAADWQAWGTSSTTQWRLCWSPSCKQFLCILDLKGTSDAKNVLYSSTKSTDSKSAFVHVGGHGHCV